MSESIQDADFGPWEARGMARYCRTMSRLAGNFFQHSCGIHTLTFIYYSCHAHRNDIKRRPPSPLHPAVVSRRQDFLMLHCFSDSDSRLGEWVPEIHYIKVPLLCATLCLCVFSRCCCRAIPTRWRTRAALRPTCRRGLAPVFNRPQDTTPTTQRWRHMGKSMSKIYFHYEKKSRGECADAAIEGWHAT